MIAKKLAAATVSGLAAALTLTGCGSVHYGTDAAASASAIGARPPVDAVPVTPTFGWVLTSDRFLTTGNDGATFTDTHVPLPAGPARAAFFDDPEHGMVAAANGNVITVARTSDGGITWTTSELTDPAGSAGVGYGRLAISFGGRTRGALLAQIQTGQNFSAATLFATTDAGKSWAAHPAPAAGQISLQATGPIWLAGGVLNNRLYRSADNGAHWSSPQLQVARGLRIAGVVPPVAGTLPVTVLNGASTQVELLTTSDGGKIWHQTNGVAVHGHTAMGVNVPVAQTADGLLVVDTAGGHAYRRRGGTAGASPADGTDIRPAGLPEGVEQVTFAGDGRTGWARATYGRCTHGKQGCTLFHDLLRTTNGGTGWQRIQEWSEPVN